MIIGRFQTFSEFVDFVKSLLIWAFIYGVAYLVMMLTAQCAIILKAGVMERGKTMGVGDALAKGVRCVPRLFVALLLVFAVVIGPLLLAFGLLFLGITTFSPLLAPLGALILIVWILPMIYVGIRLSLVAPACVLDDLGPVECVKECWRVTKGNFWLIFVTGILLWIPSMLLNLIPHVGFLIAMLIVGPASVIAFTLLYLGIKKTKLRSEVASA
jgi:membrane-anchored glycerophosphoryl diester phosphodiesterase (GDPDase)